MAHTTHAHAPWRLAGCGLDDGVLDHIPGPLWMCGGLRHWMSVARDALSSLHAVVRSLGAWPKGRQALQDCSEYRWASRAVKGAWVSERNVCTGGPQRTECMADLRCTRCKIEIWRGCRRHPC